MAQKAGGLVYAASCGDCRDVRAVRRLLGDRKVNLVVTERLRDLLKENPGVTKSAFEALAAARNLGRKGVRDFLDDGAKGGTVRIETGENNKKLHFWAEKPVGLAVAGDLELEP